jgi:hypothetical protein
VAAGAPPPTTELRPAAPETAGYMHVRAQPGWQRLPKGDQARRNILSGHRLPFKRRSKRSGFYQPCSRRLDLQFTGERVVETCRMLNKGALVPAPDQCPMELVRRGHMITPAFMVKKKGTTKKRMVYNQKRTNQEIRKRGVKLEDCRQVQFAAKPGCKVFQCDLGNVMDGGKDGYHAIQIHPADQKYLTSDQGAMVRAASLGPPDREAILAQAGVDINHLTAEEVLQYWRPIPQFVMCSALPFGYTNSVWLFTIVMRVMAKILREEHNISLTHYLDDWAFWPETDEQAAQWMPVIDQVFSDHGFMRQPGKGTVTADGTWEVVQEVVQLGNGLNTKTNVWFVTPERLKGIRTMGKQILSSADRHQGLVGALWLAQFAGVVLSTYMAVRQARFRTRPLFDDLVRGGAYQRKFSNQVRLSRESKRMILWWIQLQSHKDLGRKVWDPPVDLPWTCDACTTRGSGWGATLPSSPLTGNPQQSVGLPCAGIWTDTERELGITRLELKAVRRAIEQYRKWPVSRSFSDLTQGFESLISGRSLLLWEDNAAVVSILNNYSTSCADMREDLHAIMQMLELENAWMRTRYVASALNPSDWFSRLPSKAEWVLRQEAADVWMNWWQPCTVDRFADTDSARLPRFNSPYPCHGAEWVDAFSTSWAGECSWVNPPWKDISRVVLRLQQELAAAAVLLVPYWPSRPWFPALRSLASDSMRVAVEAADVRCTGLAEQMGVVPEVLRRAGRAENMVLFYVPSRADD